MSNVLHEMYAHVKQSSTSWLKCAQMTLGISILEKTFLLHIKVETHNTCH